jgi:hypothetical protein
MRNRLAKTLLTTAAVAACAVPVGAQASQGADDPAGQVRQESRQTVAAPASATPSPTTARKTSDDKAGRRDGRRHGRRHGRRADNGATQRRVRSNSPSTERRGRGTDDGPNHT